MKIALITDTHFGARNDNLAFNEYFYKFWENTFFPYLDEHKIDTIIHLGDLMDRRKFVSYKIAKDLRERFILPIVSRGIKMHVMAGNHDTYYKNTNEINSLYELLGGPGEENILVLNVMMAHVPKSLMEQGFTLCRGFVLITTSVL
jgi:3',5'-cyclic AMP phosphodiesterase CpdA